MHAIIRRFAPALPAALLLACVLFPIAALSGEPAADPAPSAWSEDDYGTVTLENFRKDPRFLEGIDLKRVDYPRLQAAVFYATNEIRVKHGLPALAHSPELEQAAAGHARRMVEKGFLSHKDPYDQKRATSKDRVRLAGAANPHPAENIADTTAISYVAGRGVYPSPDQPGGFSYQDGGPLIPPHTYLSFAESVISKWMDSSGHRANILSTQALELGCGACCYAKQSFFSMPYFKAVQNFQWYEKIIRRPAEE